VVYATIEVGAGNEDIADTLSSLTSLSHEISSSKIGNSPATESMCIYTLTTSRHVIEAPFHVKGLYMKTYCVGDNEERKLVVAHLDLGLRKSSLYTKDLPVLHNLHR